MRRIGQWQLPDPPFSFSGLGARNGGNEGAGRAVNFYGEFTQKIDGKGRVSIPADFRRVLERGDPDWCEGKRPRVRIVYGRPGAKFLECYTIDAITEVEARIRTLPEHSKARRRLEIVMITGSDTCDVDSDGRIVLAPKLRDRIGLAEGEAVFAGTLDTFQIWTPADFEADKAALLAELEDDLPDDADILSLLPPKTVA